MDVDTLRDELLRRAQVDTTAPQIAALLARLWQQARQLAPPGAMGFRGGGAAHQSRSDEALLRDFIAGDTEAFEPLAMRYLAKLKGYALRYVSEADADDAVQEALLVVLRKGRSLSGEAAFRRYVFHTLLNKLRERQRNVSRTARREKSLSDVESAYNPDDDQPEIALLRQQRDDALADAFLECLDPLDQELLLLWFECDGEDSPAEFVGAALEMNPQTVRVHKCRALKRLREWFEARGEGGG